MFILLKSNLIKVGIYIDRGYLIFILIFGSGREVFKGEWSLIFDKVSSILIFDKRGGCHGKKKKGSAKKGP